MAHVSIEQLKTLIQSSTIFSPAEQQEWLRLVEFMNDKQLLDLYKILVPDSPAPKVQAPAPKPTSSVPLAPVAPAPQIQKTVPPPQPPKPAVTPNPKPAASVNVGEGASLQAFLKRTMQAKNPEPPKPAKPVVPVKRIKPLNKFSRWKNGIQNMVQEKELPAPHTEAIEAPHEPSEPAPDTPPAPRAEPPPTPPVSKPAPPAAEQPSASPDFSQGVSEVKVLDDVRGVTLGTLRAVGIQTLTEQLMHVIKKNGYFEVLFALEQSPLYRMYLATGKKLIDAQVGFDNIAEDDDTWNHLLNKQEFEGFADTLRHLATM